jgi:hypothetical protein
MAIGLIFIILNRAAYDGFFQDDELDNITWAPYVGTQEFVTSFFTPKFLPTNFRPVGHFYFAVMGRHFGLDFPPYMTPIFIIHLVTGLLLYLLLRKFALRPWIALAGTAFFVWSVGAFDAYWKPMYVFDLLCTAFCLASMLLYAHGRWILSLIAFWFAYKSKELAVMLPAVLLIYEYWFGKRNFRRLIPFLVIALSFGVQGIVLNPNKNNDYTFRFTPHALLATIPFYARRFLYFRFSGLALCLLVLVRDRRVWFGLGAMLLFLLPLLFLPGRRFEAYLYLPLASATLALTAAASRLHPAWAWVALALWMPWNIHELRIERRAKLAADDEAYSYVESIQAWVAKTPEIDTYVYDGAPVGYHHWGVTAAWNYAHHRLGLRALHVDWPEARQALTTRPVALGSWNPVIQKLTIKVHTPSR